EPRLQLAFKRRDKRDCFSIIHGDTGGEGDDERTRSQGTGASQPADCPAAPCCAFAFSGGGVWASAVPSARRWGTGNRERDRRQRTHGYRLRHRGSRRLGDVQGANHDTSGRLGVCAGYFRHLSPHTQSDVSELSFLYYWPRTGHRESLDDSSRATSAFVCPGTHHQARRGLSDPALRAGLRRISEKGTALVLR